MTADAFWKIIASYNEQTIYVQAAFLILLIISVVAAWTRTCYALPKIVLGAAHLFIGIVFFYYFGTEKIQHYFAGPLFIAAGLLFLYDAVTHFHDQWQHFSRAGALLLGIVLLYPAVSFALGHRFPEMVVYIMPCPLVSCAIIIYAQYSRKNILLLLLLIIWGLTGIKSFFFNVPEDTILLICGVYGICVLFCEYRNRKTAA